MELFRDGVIAIATAGAASEQPPHSEPQTFDGAVAAQGLNCV